MDTAARSGISKASIGNHMAVKKKKTATRKKSTARKLPTLGQSIITGLKEAVAWAEGNNRNVRVTLVQLPEIDVKEVRIRMGLSQAQFATRFGFPPATLRNWEQGRSRPDAPTRVLLAVLAKHPDAVDDVLRAAN
jgi:putative transcriptional regulator